MKNKQKTSVQISNDLHNDLKSFCKANGYKLSGVVEMGIKSFISGSKSFIEEKQKNKQLLQG